MTFLESLLDLERRGGTGAVCTVVQTRGSAPRRASSKMLVHEDGRIEGTVGGGRMEALVIQEALDAMARGEPRLVHYDLKDLASGDPGVCGGEVEIFVEPIQGQPKLLVIGGGHVGRALVHLGQWLGFRVALSDDRLEHCTPEAVPGAEEYLAVPAAELAGKFAFTRDTYILMPTRGMLVDVGALPFLLDVPHAYIGIIGSRRRWAKAMKELVAKGVPKEKLAGVHSPMGLELNAETPEEIALSILAEIVMLRRRGTGEPMRWMGPPEPADGPSE